MKTTKLPFTCLFLLTGPAWGQIASSYRFTDLGSLGGPTISVAGINDSGVIVGSADTTQIDPSTTANIYNAFRTTATQGSLTNLGALPGGLSSEAYGINNAGTIIGSSDTKNSYDFGVNQAFSIIRSTSTSSLSSANALGTLPSGTDEFSSAFAINTAGTIVGTSTVKVQNSNGGTDYSADAYSVPAGTTLSGATDLGRFNGKALAPLGLNDSGVIVGAGGVATMDADGNEVVNPQAVILDGSGARLLGNLGGSQSFAYDINNSGQIAGYSYITGDAVIHAFNIDGSGMHDLGTLGGTNSYAAELNNAGVIVGASDLSDGSTHAFVDFGGVMIDLNKLISTTTPLGSFTLGGASAINNLGQIAGTSLIDGAQHAFLLTPIFDGVYWTGAKSANWNTDGNWNAGVSNEVPGAVPTSASDVYFSTTTPAPGHLVESTVNAPISIHSLTFLDGAALTVIGNSGNAANTLTIGGGGISVQSASANYGIDANVVLAATQNWNIGPSTGANTSNLIVSGNISDDGKGYGLIKLGKGTLTFNGSNTYTGGTFVLGGLVSYGTTASASGAHTISGGSNSGGQGGIVEFNGSADVGSSSFTNNAGNVSGAFGGSTQFKDASAAHGTFTNNGADVAGANGGTTKFFATSTAGEGSFKNRGGTVAGAAGGITQFNDSSSADSGQFSNESGTFAGAAGGSTQFLNNSKASTTSTSASTFTNNGSTVAGAQGGFTKFNNDASAGTGNFINQDSSVTGSMESGADNGTTQYVSGTTVFTGTSDAGHGTFSNQKNRTATGSIGGATIFLSSSEASAGTFTNAGGNLNGGDGGATLFHDTTRASFFGTASFFTNEAGTVSGANGGSTSFFEDANAGPGTATFTNQGSTVAGALGGMTKFNRDSDAGNGVFNNNDSTVSGLTVSGRDNGTTQYVSGATIFSGNSLAGSGTFNNNKTSTASGSTGGVTIFLASSTAYNGHFNNAGGNVSGGSSGATIFRDTARASFFDTASIFINRTGTVDGGTGGSTVFADSANAGPGHATFNNLGGATSGALGGSTVFSNTTSATTGAFYSDGASVTGAKGGVTAFHDTATADKATFTNNGGVGPLLQPLIFVQAGKTQFYDNSTAANGRFTNNGGTGGRALGGATEFYNNSTAGAATLIANASDSSTISNVNSQGGRIYFYNASTGGTARVEVFGKNIFGDGFLDISQHDAGTVTIGSLEGNGEVYLGSNTLAIGSNNDDTTFSGVIDNGGGPNEDNATGGPTVATGSLIKIGTGTLTLTGKNTFAGSTFLQAGVLNVGNANALNTTLANNPFTSNGNIRFGGGTLQFSAANQEDYSSRIKDSNASVSLDTNGQNVTFASAIDSTNTRGLTKLGSGILTLAAPNTYTGGTIVSGGSISISADNNLGGGDVVLNNGSTLQFTGSFTLNHRVTVSGDPTFDVGTGLTDIIAPGIADGASPGELVKAGTGTLILSGDNTYTGPTTVNAGTLQAGVAGHGFGVNSAVTVNQPGTLDTAGFDNTIGSLAGSGLVSLGSHVLTIGGDNTGTTFSGVLQDGGAGGSIIKTGTGKLILTAANTYTGTTSIDGGVLEVDGSLASVQTIVNPGGTLRGIGTLAGNIENNGTVSPGHSPGTLRLAGNFQQNTGGTLRIEIAGRNPGQFDLLAVGGRAALGGRLQILTLGSFQPTMDDHFIFLNASGGVKGTFATIQKSPSLVTFSVNYQKNSVVLEVAGTQFGNPTPSPVASFGTGLPGLSSNQQSIAQAIDRASTDAHNDSISNFLLAQDVRDLPADFERIAPEELTALFQTSFSLSSTQAANIEHRLSDIRSGSRGFSSNGLAVAGITKSDGKTLGDDKSVTAPAVFAATPDNRWGVFATGTGEYAEVDSDGKTSGYDLTSGGLTIGIDYRLSNEVAVGLTTGYARTRADLAGDGKIDIDSGSGSLFMTFYRSHFYLNAVASGGYNSYDTRRQALLGDAHGRSEGSQWDVRLSAGYDCQIGSCKIGPFAALDYTDVELNRFTEHGSLAPLQIEDQSEQSARSELGLRASRDWKVGSVIFTPEISATWQHEYLDRAPSIGAKFATDAGGVFSVNGPALGRDSALVSAGVTCQCSPQMAISLDYSGEFFRADYLAQSLNAGVRWSF